MQERAKPSVAFSHMSVTAALSILALLALVFWQLVAHFASPPLTAVAPAYQTNTDEMPSWQSSLAALASTSGVSASTTDPVASASAGAMAEIIGAYAGFQSAGGYTQTSGTQIGNSIGASLSAPVPFREFSLTDIHTDADTSYQRMLKYRSDLQAALKPLLNNKKSEFELFAQYISTNDPSYLSQISAAAKNYYTAASSTELVVAPQDAASIQLDMLNAMEQFAATLDSMVAHASDPLASTMLLQDFNTAEGNVLSSFNALAQYEKNKQQ